MYMHTRTYMYMVKNRMRATALQLLCIVFAISVDCNRYSMLQLISATCLLLINVPITYTAGAHERK
jgi:hypothetical protein